MCRDSFALSVTREVVQPLEYRTRRTSAARDARPYIRPLNAETALET